MIDYDEEQAAAILKQWMRGAQKRMSALPVARYLIEFVATAMLRGAAPRPCRAAQGEPASDGPRPRRGGACEGPRERQGGGGSRDGRHAGGAEGASPQELAAAREAWASEEGGRLAEQLAAGLRQIGSAVADTIARILKPFLGAKLRARRSRDLVESWSVLRAQDAGIQSAFRAPMIFWSALARAARGQGRGRHLSFRARASTCASMPAGPCSRPGSGRGWKQSRRRCGERRRRGNESAGDHHHPPRAGGGEEEGHHGGVWKIAYADFMTAMMAFFLVMWLINSTDKKTLTQVATYFNPLRLTDKTADQPGCAAGVGCTKPRQPDEGRQGPPGNRRPGKRRPGQGRQAEGQRGQGRFEIRCQVRRKVRRQG